MSSELKLVPVEPTEEMMDAFYGAVEITRVGSVRHLSEGYKAMLAAAPSATPPASREEWNFDMSAAPRDGTRILIWFVHANAKYSSDPVAEGWACAHEAHWIDFNGGGWTWHGLCGVATAWQPLPAPPVSSDGGRDAG